MGFPGVSDGNESACNVGHPGSVPGLGRSPGGGNGNPLQYSCLENPMDRGDWWATVLGVSRVGHNLETNPPPNRGITHVCLSPARLLNTDPDTRSMGLNEALFLCTS